MNVNKVLLFFGLLNINAINCVEERKHNIIKEDNHKDVSLLTTHINVGEKQESKNNLTIHESLLTSSNSTLESRRKKTRKRKKKRRNKTKKLNLSDSVMNKTNTENVLPKTEARKRERKKKRQKIQQSFKNNTNATVFRLIDQLNQNPKGTRKKPNRCSLNNGGCSQICKPKGKNKCFCLKGFRLAKNRKKCIDINECKFRNGNCKEICTNTVGAFYCDCPLGLRISEDLKSCEDINECYLRNGHGPCQDTCTNTYGSYVCDCSHLNGTRLGFDKHSCEDIDECQNANAGCSHICINTKVGAFCNCPEGMELMSDYKSCQDIDECETEAKCKQGCVNTIGSYYCEEEIQGDCHEKVSVCPPLEPPKHGYVTCLRNYSLPYEKFSKSGRKIVANYPGTKCKLQCPEGFKLIGDGRFLCGTVGKWIVRTRGTCIKASHPKLECPSNQYINLGKEQETTLVHFPSPQTNVRWKNIKSYPKWAKNLKGELGIGHHYIQFLVTDPASKLSSSCSFFIIINK